MSKRVYRNRSFIRSFNQVQQELDRPTNGLIVLSGIILVAMIMVGLIWQKVKVTQLAQEIEQLEKQMTYFKETNEKLQGKVLHLSREDRIVNIARTRLNMTYPPYEMVSLPEKRSKEGSED